MASNTKIYSSSLFSYITSRAEGVTVQWTQNLVPIGDREISGGDLVEMLAHVSQPIQESKDQVRVRFDILKKDFLISNAPTDRVVSFRSPGMPPLAEPALSVERLVAFRRLDDGQTLHDIVEAFKAERLSDFQEQILMVQGNDKSEFDLITWWFASQDGDERSEFFHTVRIEDMGEVQSDTYLNVISPSVEPVQLTPPLEPDPNWGTMLVNVSFINGQEDIDRYYINVQGTTKTGVPVSFDIHQHNNGTFQRLVPAGDYRTVLMRRPVGEGKAAQLPEIDPENVANIEQLTGDLWKIKALVGKIEDSSLVTWGSDDAHTITEVLEMYQSKSLHQMTIILDLLGAFRTEEGETYLQLLVSGLEDRANYAKLESFLEGTSYSLKPQEKIDRFYKKYIKEPVLDETMPKSDQSGDSILKMKTLNREERRELLTHLFLQRRLLDYYSKLWDEDYVRLRRVVYLEAHAVDRLPTSAVARYQADKLTGIPEKALVSEGECERMLAVFQERAAQVLFDILLMSEKRTFKFEEQYTSDTSYYYSEWGYPQSVSYVERRAARIELQRAASKLAQLDEDLRKAEDQAVEAFLDLMMEGYFPLPEEVPSSITLWRGASRASGRGYYGYTAAWPTPKNDWQIWKNQRHEDEEREMAVKLIRQRGKEYVLQYPDSLDKAISAKSSIFTDYLQARERLSGALQLRSSWISRYPVLSRPGIFELAKAEKIDDKRLNDEIRAANTEILKNIREVRDRVFKGSLRVLSLEVIVEATLKDLGIQPDSRWFQMLKEHAREVKEEQESWDRFWEYLNIGLGIVAMIAGLALIGGAAVPGYIAAIASVGTVATGIVVVARSTQQYLLAKAASGSDYDPAMVLMQGIDLEDMWKDLLFAWLGLGMDVLGAVADIAALRHLTRVRSMEVFDPNDEQVAKALRFYAKRHGVDFDDLKGSVNRLEGRKIPVDPGPPKILDPRDISGLFCNPVFYLVPKVLYGSIKKLAYYGKRELWKLGYMLGGQRLSYDDILKLMKGKPIDDQTRNMIKSFKELRDSLEAEGFRNLRLSVGGDELVVHGVSAANKPFSFMPSQFLQRVDPSDRVAPVLRILHDSGLERIVKAAEIRPGAEVGLELEIVLNHLSAKRLLAGNAGEAALEQALRTDHELFTTIQKTLEADGRSELRLVLDRKRGLTVKGKTAAGVEFSVSGKARLEAEAARVGTIQHQVYAEANAYLAGKLSSQLAQRGIKVHVEKTFWNLVELEKVPLKKCAKILNSSVEEYLEIAKQNPRLRSLAEKVGSALEIDMKSGVGNLKFDLLIRDAGQEMNLIEDLTAQSTMAHEAKTRLYAMLVEDLLGETTFAVEKYYKGLDAPSIGFFTDTLEQVLDGKNLSEFISSPK